MTRRLSETRTLLDPTDAPFSLAGRSTLLVRNVGLHMTTPAVLLPNAVTAPEGILDALVTTLIAKTDLIHRGYANSSTGAIYVVKPKLHGPEEARFTDRLFEAVEDLLELPRHTVKLGLMDEERRTSANLAACIHALERRLAFINTGFLDRTGDEIHTSMAAGPMRTKASMKSVPFLTAHEDRNVRIGLACGLSGRAQIGKGMWAMPNRMRAMMEQKNRPPSSWRQHCVGSLTDGGDAPRYPLPRRRRRPPPERNWQSKNTRARRAAENSNTRCAT